MDLPDTESRDLVAGRGPDGADDAGGAGHAGRRERDPADVPLVDWVVTARRVGRSAVALVLLAVLGWAVRAALVDAWSWAHLGNWLGLAVAGIFVVELFVVGGSALRGMLRAGERGERLSSHDVGLLPPLRRHRAASGTDGAPVDPSAPGTGDGSGDGVAD